MGKEKKLFENISALIEQSRRTIYAQANSTTVSLFWQIGKYINGGVLEDKRADYGEQVVITLSQMLEEKYGRSFEIRNLRRMMQFAEQFPDFEIVSPAATQLS
jgi:hypothetical protein